MTICRCFSPLPPPPPSCSTSSSTAACRRAGRWINDALVTDGAYLGGGYTDGGSISLTVAPRVLIGIDRLLNPVASADLSGSIYINPGARLDVTAGGYVRPDRRWC